jgi:hypothetical protein
MTNQCRTGDHKGKGKLRPQHLHLELSEEYE